MGMKNLEESRPDFTKNWPNEKKHFENLASEISMSQKLRESHDAIQKFTSQIQELQERMNNLNDSRESISDGKNIPRSQSTGNSSKSLWDADPRPKFAI